MRRFLYIVCIQRILLWSDFASLTTAHKGLVPVPVQLGMSLEMSLCPVQCKPPVTTEDFLGTTGSASVL